MSEFEHERLDVYRIAIEAGTCSSKFAPMPTAMVLRLNESGSGSGWRSRSG